MPNWTPNKALKLRVVTEKYQELKGLRNGLIAEKMREIDVDMSRAKSEFADYLQALYEAEDLGFRVTVSDLATAMGTSSRNTVYDYLGDARERKTTRFIDNIAKTTFVINDFNNDVLPGDSILTVKLNDGEKDWKIEYKEKWGYYRVWGNGGFLNWRDGETKQIKDGITFHRPDFLDWLEQTTEWQEKGW
jgi:hypothetical protein